MRFIVDSMFPRSLVTLLRELGHDAIHAKQLGINGTTDDRIWREAENMEAVVISMDSDFPPLAEASIRAKLIHYTGGNTTAHDLKKIFAAKLPSAIAKLERGAKISDIR